MDEKKYVVPEGMLKAASGQGFQTSKILEAALRWLAENPPEITSEMVAEACNVHDGHSFPEFRHMFRVAFLAPEPEIPEAVKDLIVDLGISPELSISRKQFNRDILEAFRRGALSQNEK